MSTVFLIKVLFIAGGLVCCALLFVGMSKRYGMARKCSKVAQTFKGRTGCEITGT